MKNIEVIEVAKACPLCNGITIGVKDSISDGHYAWAYCSKCGRIGEKVLIPANISDHELINMAYKAWNED